MVSAPIDRETGKTGKNAAKLSEFRQNADVVLIYQARHIPRILLGPNRPVGGDWRFVISEEDPRRSRDG